MKISVIVPIFNVERYLRQCINSIVNQSYADLEIILVDDGSTDNSFQICKEASDNDSRIIAITQENAGVSAARNTGIKISSGDYITFVDSDDWLNIDIYQLMAEAIQSNPNVEVVMCDFTTVTNVVEVNVSSYLAAGLYSKKDIIRDIYPTLLVTEDFGRLPIISACTCLFKKSLFVNYDIHFDVSLRYSEDYLFMAEVMTKSESYYYLKDCYGYNYRQCEESRSKKYQPEWWSTLKTLNKRLKQLLGNSPEFDFTRQLKLQLIHSALFLSTTIFYNQNIPHRQKAALLKEIFNEKELKAVFANLRFNKQSFPSQIILYMIKHGMGSGYLIYRNVISKIKKLGHSK
ncbi:Glycosyl transferase family 2 [Kaistella chaponensis]|uniref:Glycosyl transferase family 2 n=1 Tax=Kaistella chaponensis TaxID=713588 RepID=A0A1N7J691_9FLAO|nr:glycosyltransferase family A protein [Kaistella chaponensis]SIS44824.1 Glycosyl transferase family 2 [Kaistella chaponensis]